MPKAAAPREKIILRRHDPDRISSLMEDLNISPMLAAILAGRGLTDFEESRRFFNPALSHFHEPFLFRQMNDAVERIMRAITAQETICIYGDYDVDGISATSFMIRTLRTFGLSCFYYVPNRLTEGYGISPAGLEDIHRRGADLVISVDTGITAVEEVTHARSLGMDIIITDHHEPKKQEPDCIVLDPKSRDETYPDRNLCGAGVALKLIQALCSSMDAPQSVWMNELDLVALGTAADIVPYTGENRVISYFGYQQMSRTINAGLRALMEEQNVSTGRITTADIVFRLAPAINAAGRLGDPARAVELFLSSGEGECRLYAQNLVKKNRERRGYNSRVEREADAWVQQYSSLSEDFALVAADRGWHAGVIGIAASKIAERYCRPAFIFSIDTDGVAHGSGRSIQGCNLISAMDSCNDLLTRYGGHTMAAGATLDADNIPEFRTRFKAAVREQITEDDLIPSIYADVEVRIPQLTPRFFRTLQRMEPFGPGNMRPVLYTKDVEVNSVKRVGKAGAHLKMRVSQAGQQINAIAFGFGERAEEIRRSTQREIAYTLRENTFNGMTSLQIEIKGIIT
ncbi:MAG: single-stranded-DNA-specific exonuclease RecJ [Fibrobacterota bacterium]